ncbi:hypothetical protein D3C80_2125200 [compost metagenome]
MRPTMTNGNDEYGRETGMPCNSGSRGTATAIMSSLPVCKASTVLAKLPSHLRSNVIPSVELR